MTTIYIFSITIGATISCLTLHTLGWAGIFGELIGMLWALTLTTLVINHVKNKK